MDCQRYFSLLLPCTTCVALRCNRGRIGTAFGLTRNSALYFNCLLFSRFGDNIFIPLFTRLLAVPILCPVEVGFHRCYDRDLATHIPYFSFVLAPQSRQIRWHYLSSKKASTRCFSHQHFLCVNGMHFTPCPPLTTNIWLAWSSHLSTHLTVGAAPNI